MQILKTLHHLLLAEVLATSAIIAQPITDAQGDVGIGTTSPDPSALLEMRSTTKGFLLPRMTTAERDNISLPATGLVIYNGEAQELQYNFGTPTSPMWVRVLTDNAVEDLFDNSVWKLEGNGSTTPFDGVAGDFLGTTDDADLVIVTGGDEQVRFYSPSNGGGFETTGPFRPDGIAGVMGQVLISQGPNATPMWTNELTLDSLSLADGLFIGGEVNVGGDASFNGEVTFATLPTIPLNQGYLLVGDALNSASPFPPGTTGQVLQIDGSGVPAWQSVGVVSTGIGTNTILVWNGSAWVENTNFMSDPSNGNTVIGGTLTVSGPGVTLPAGSVDNGELANSSINLSYGTGLSGDPSVGLGGTLNLQNTGVTSVAGTTNQVNVSGSTGAVTLSLPQDIGTGSTPTFSGVTLSGLSGGSTSTEIVTSNGGSLESRSINSLIGAATLAQNNIWVGNAGNNPSQLPPGTEGQVLSIVGGIPVWANTSATASTDVTTASTTDETFALRGTASGGTTNQVAGVWGRATDPSAGNIGTMGVFATGNGNTTAGETNAAFQMTDGELRMGRTTETGTGYTVVEGATGGAAYSAEGPSGVIEISLTLANSSPLAGALVGVLNTVGTPLGAPTLGSSVNSALGLSVFTTTVTINNRYVTPQSIVLAQIVDMSDTDLLEDIITLFQNGNLTASTAVTNRQSGSFDFTLDLRSLGPVPALNNGAIRIGYIVVNPSQ